MDSADSNIDEAFVMEISESQTQLRSYIWKLAGNGHDADDILQKTNVILWQKRMEWDPETVFLKWAYRIAYFQVKAHFRDLGRDQKRLYFDDSVLDLLAEDEPHFQTSQGLLDALEHCLGKLDSPNRSLLLRRYEGEVSVNTLSEELGYTANRLSQKLLRMRSKLSDCIQSQLNANA